MRATISGLLLVVLSACGGVTQTVEDSGSPDSSPDVAITGPATIVSGLPAYPSRMLSDGTTLFWIDSQSGAVVSAPAIGGQPTTIATGASGTALALDDTNVFFLKDNAFITMSKTGGAPTVVSDGNVARGATVTQGTAFWTDVDSQSLGHSFVNQSPAHGGPVTSSIELADPLPAIDIAVTTHQVFLADTTVTYVPIVGGSVQSVSNVLDCNEIVADEIAAYCLPSSSGAAMRIAEDGTATTLVGNVFAPRGLSVDDANVYWADNPDSGGVVKSVSKQGGPATIVAAEKAMAVAVDGVAVYWATPDGSIRRLMK